MEEEISVYDFASPVHRVLLEPNLLFGIGMTSAMLILVLTIVLMNLVSVWTFPLGIVLFIVCRLLCKKDPYMLTILFDRLMQPSVWRAF
ncbi:MAG: VirB3 family type IV secretion system protein [Treponema sp.]|nr:VirB3 family type IV secretion system protein [Treponema sp.]MBR0100002.1 VirB3 family type IV secretion system protein [Treponema sp.]